MPRQESCPTSWEARSRGTVLPEGTKVTVVDSTADYRWMVLPMRPAATAGWSEAQLAAIVREGDMIGVTVPSLTHASGR